MGDQKRLTARFAETVKKAGKYFDENGLFLRVKEGGSKKWVQRYTFSGKRREMGLGSAKVISLAKARLKSYELRPHAREMDWVDSDKSKESE